MDKIKEVIPLLKDYIYSGTLVKVGKKGEKISKDDISLIDYFLDIVEDILR